jgi:tRNA (guanine37-N1)-methyltransferase
MTLKRCLGGVVPDNLLAEIPDRFEVIGDIAIISLPSSCEPYQEDIALAILSLRRNIRTVLSRLSIREGEARVARFRTILGTSTVTTHREFGFRYQLDVARVFFSPRLATERQRILAQIRPGEEILVPFCGVGPSVIPAAAKGARVTAIDQNPEAIVWLEKNLVLNRVDQNVRVLAGDARIIVGGLSPVFDRAICPTPYGMDGFLRQVTPLVKTGGMIHFYTFCNPRQAADLAGRLPGEGLEVLLFRDCGHVAPRVNRYIYDLRKKGDQGS